MLIYAIRMVQRAPIAGTGPKAAKRQLIFGQQERAKVKLSPKRCLSTSTQENGRKIGNCEQERMSSEELSCRRRREKEHQVQQQDAGATYKLGLQRTWYVT